MAGVCILTDSTVQFPAPAFTGRNLVHVIPLSVEIGGQLCDDQLRAADLPVSKRHGVAPQAVPPSVKEFEKMFISLSKRYDEVVVILHSNQLSRCCDHAIQAAKVSQGNIKITVIDGQTTATGLGLVVQQACSAAEQGMSSDQIEDMIRSLLPRMYTVFFSEGLTYFQREGFLGEAQALVAEYLRILPMFILDNGILVPAQKARNYRHMVDLMYEFLCEFTELDHIALVQGVPPFENETRALRERIALDFPTVPISEHTISAPLAAMIGPRSLGLFVLQKEG